MRTYVVVICVVGLAALTLSSPRRTRQVNPEDDVSSDRFWENRPTRPARPTRPSRPTRPTPTPVPSTTTPPGPPSQQALLRCMASCLRTPQYDPLCTNLVTGERKTYSNSGERMCAEFCGESSTILYRGSCTAIS